MSARSQLSPGAQAHFSVPVYIFGFLTCLAPRCKYNQLTHFNYTGSQFSQCLTMHLSGCAVKGRSPCSVMDPGMGGAPQCHLCALYVVSSIYLHMYVYESCVCVRWCHNLGWAGQGVVLNSELPQAKLR